MTSLTIFFANLALSLMWKKGLIPRLVIINRCCYSPPFFDNSNMAYPQPFLLWVSHILQRQQCGLLIVLPIVGFNKLGEIPFFILLDNEFFAEFIFYEF